MRPRASCRALAYGVRREWLPTAAMARGSIERSSFMRAWMMRATTLGAAPRATVAFARAHGLKFSVLFRSDFGLRRSRSLPDVRIQRLTQIVRTDGDMRDDR